MLINSAIYEHSYVLKDYVGELYQDVTIVSSWKVTPLGVHVYNKQQEVRDGENCGPLKKKAEKTTNLGG